jgi:hypothetical protein
MSQTTKTKLAEWVAATTWLWAPSAPAAFYYAEGSFISLGVAIATSATFLFSRRASENFFRSRWAHRLLPWVLGIDVAAVAHLVGFGEASCFFSALTGLGGGEVLARLLWDAQLPEQTSNPDLDPNFLRGARRTSFSVAAKRAADHARTGEPTFTFGPIQFVYSFLVNNVFVFGAPGAGKTMLLLLALKSVLPTIKRGSGKRFVVYDAKEETISRLAPLGFTGRLIIANFTDARCSEWLLGADLTDNASIGEAANLFAPVTQTGNSAEQFFDLAARGCIAGEMKSFNNRSPGTWTLSDLINGAESPERLRQILEWSLDDNYALLNTYFRNQELSENIVATVRSKFEPFAIVGAYWKNAPHRFSLTGFLKEDGVGLVLGRPIEAKDQADALNSLMFARLSELIIKRENRKTTDTFLFLDEISKCGRLRHLDDLLLQGRSKGATTWLGGQSIGAMNATYGRDITGDLQAGCGNVAVLALADPDTAEHCEKLFGIHERWEKSVGHSSTSGPHGNSYTFNESYSITRKPCVLASEFLSIEPPNKLTRAPLKGFYRVPGVGGCFEAEIAIDQLQQEIPDTGARGQGRDEDYVPAPASRGKHKRWTDDELRHFGLATRSSGLGAPPEDPDPFKTNQKPPRTKPPTGPSLDNLKSPFRKAK